MLHVHRPVIHLCRTTQMLVIYTCHQQTRHTLYVTPADKSHSIHDINRHVTLCTWHQNTHHTLYMTPEDTSRYIHDTSRHVTLYTWHQRTRHAIYMTPEYTSHSILTPEDTSHSLHDTSGHRTFYTWHQQTRRTIYILGRTIRYLGGSLEFLLLANFFFYLREKTIFFFWRSTSDNVSFKNFCRMLSLLCRLPFGVFLWSIYFS